MTEEKPDLESHASRAKGICIYKENGIRIPLVQKEYKRHQCCPEQAPPA
jgi:hypothetical protein